MDKAERELKRILVSELGVDVRMFSPVSIGAGLSGYAPTHDRGKAQWGRTQDGLAIFPIAWSNNTYVAIGIKQDGTHEEPREKTATAADFEDSAMWIAVER